MAQAAAKVPGVRKVLHVEAEAYAQPVAEELAALILSVADAYDYLLAASTTTGKNVMPRVAALLDTAQISDIVEVLGPGHLQALHLRRQRAGDGQEHGREAGDHGAHHGLRGGPGEGGNAEIVTVAAVEPAGLPSSSAARYSRSDRPDLGSARIVVSGGRGLGSAENFKLVEDLADALGARDGCRRAAVDAGFAPNDWQVGQTGKIVAPELYVAVGISGAIQHLAGMKDSKVIVAINKDEEAPIFQVADYGLVGDLFKLRARTHQRAQASQGVRSEKPPLGAESFWRAPWNAS